jgi:hypothetical protein
MQQLLIHKNGKITTYTYKMKINLLLINYSPERSEKEKDIVENTYTQDRQCRNYTHLK